MPSLVTLKSGLKCMDLCAIECEHMANENLENVIIHYLMLTMMKFLMTNCSKYQNFCAAVCGTI